MLFVKSGKDPRIGVSTGSAAVGDLRGFNAVFAHGLPLSLPVSFVSRQPTELRFANANASARAEGGPR